MRVFFVCPLTMVMLSPQVGFVFERVQEIYPESINIAHVTGHVHQQVHDAADVDDTTGACSRHFTL